MLDNAGDEREPGDTDHYLVVNDSVWTSDIQWAYLRKLKIGLQRTDGWFLREIGAHMLPDQLWWEAYDSSHVVDERNQWLDSGSSTSWDYASAEGYWGIIRFPD